MLCSTFVGDVQQTAFRIPKIVVERMMHHHSDEAAHDNRRIHLDKRSLALSLTDVAAKELVHTTHKLVEEHLRELVLLERGVEQQSLKLRIVLVMIQRTECQRLKNATIVFATDRVGRHLSRFKLASRARFVVENGGVKLLLGGEMPEDHRL